MKLAEALAERSDCQVRIEELKKRTTRTARVQEGEKPAEDPAALLKEANSLFARLQELITAINRTNSHTTFDKGRTLSDAIAERDVTGKKRDFLTAITEAASTRQDRYSKSEVKYLATISISETQKEIDRLAKHYREIDTSIQELNWKTDLV